MPFLPGLRRQAHPEQLTEPQQKMLVPLEAYAGYRGVQGYTRLDPDWPIERVVREAYSRSIWVWRAVDAIAAQVASLTYQGKRGKTVLDDDPRARLLNGKEANTYESGTQFAYRLSAQVLLSPTGAKVQVTRNQRGEPGRYDLLPVGRTKPKSGSDGTLIDHWEVAPPPETPWKPPRVLSKEEVLWVGRRHPTDPLRCTTPLDAAGLSVELDHYARLFNREFMASDGRPGGVLAVKGDFEDGAVAKLEQRFTRGGGPLNAGRVSVINVDDMAYIDTAQSPRDASYDTTASTARMEILAAYGVPESQLGHAAGATFANATEERRAFWVVTMSSHLDVLCDGLDDNPDDTYELVPDLSKIDVLHDAEVRQREEWRAEVAAGLRSIDSYLELIGEEPFDVPGTRALWVPGGHVPVGTKEGDQDVLAKLVPAQAGMAANAAQNAPTGKTEGDPATAGDAAAQRGRDFRPARPPADAAAAEGKTAEPPADERDQLAALVESTLQQMMVRKAAVTAERVRSVPVRRGTRHWQPPGDAPLDVAAAVDPDRWAREAYDDILAVLLPAAERAAEALLDDVEGKALEPRFSDATRPEVEAVARMVADAVRAKAQTLVTFLSEQDQTGAAVADMQAAVRDWAQEQSRWARSVAQHAAGATIEGSRHAVAVVAGYAATWMTRRDDRVRDTHKKADGQNRRAGNPFVVGGALLRYPGDPRGPLDETANCRCFTLVRHAASGRFVSTRTDRTPALA